MVVVIHHPHHRDNLMLIWVSSTAQIFSVMLILSHCKTYNQSFVGESYASDFLQT